jgi:hypothetical protein
MDLAPLRSGVIALLNALIGSPHGGSWSDETETNRSARSKGFFRLNITAVHEFV